MISNWPPHLASRYSLLATCIPLGLLMASLVLAQAGEGTAGGGGSAGGLSSEDDSSASGAVSGTGTGTSSSVADPNATRSSAPGLVGSLGPGSTDQGAAGRGSSAHTSQGQAGTPHPFQGDLTHRDRIALQRQQRSPHSSPEHERAQLHDLNDISRQLDPSGAVPAPGLERRAGDR